MKIRLFQPVSFDGKTYEGEIDTTGTPISAECIIQRGWGEEIKEPKRSKKSDQEQPSTDSEQASVNVAPQSDEPPAESIVSEPVVVDPPKTAQKSRKAK